MRVETYELKAMNGSGKHVRMATKVIFPDGHEIKFMEKMSNGEAIKQAQEMRAKEPPFMVNPTTKTIEKPPYMVKKETFLTESGTELILGYIVVNIHGEQVSPPRNQVFLSSYYAEESYKNLLISYWEMKEMGQRINAEAMIQKEKWREINPSEVKESQIQNI